MVERIIVGPMKTNAYIYSEWKKECILIDPGGDADVLIHHMTMKNLKPRGILCTHGHLDHVGSANLIKTFYEEQNTHVPIAVHKKDQKYFGPKALEIHRHSIEGQDLDAAWYLEQVSWPIPPADVLLVEGKTVFDSSLMTIHTPGHTPGSCCFYNEQQETLFSGDTLYFEDAGFTNAPGSDEKALRSSIRKKLKLLPPSTRIYPGHGPLTTIERELKHNPYME